MNRLRIVPTQKLAYQHSNKTNIEITNMQKIKTPWKIVVAAFFLLTLEACTEEEAQVKPVPTSNLSTVTFSTTTLSISEAVGLNQISMTLTKAATKDGTIRISTTTPHLTRFRTEPALQNGELQLPISEGQSSVQFTFTPIDNLLYGENVSLDFTIKEVSDGLLIGVDKLLTVTILDNESPTSVEFAGTQGVMQESNEAGMVIPVTLALTSPGEGSVEVSLGETAALYGQYFTTEPAAVDGKITLPVSVGTTQVPIKVVPINNAFINGHQQINFTLSSASGAVIKGNRLTYQLNIVDDELAGRKKSYTTSGGGWSTKRKYEYNAVGQLTRVYWEQNTPGLTAGSYLYEYDEAGKLVKMIEPSYQETYYRYENGKITKAEVFRNGVLQSYVTYGYDGAGNIGETGFFYRQPDGQLKMGLLLVLLYHQDGNIYKKMAYSPVDGEEEYALLTTETYDNYLSSENPFSMVEILPTVDTMPNLPGSYRYEGNGRDLWYHFTYEFNAEGQPTKRSVGTETTVYEYY